MKLLSVVFMLLGSTSSLANCGQIRPNELWALIKKNHPRLLEAKAATDVASTSIEVARVRPNPEMSLSSDTGESLEGTVRSFGAEMMFPIELGGKRSARIERANRLKDLSQSEEELNRADALIETYMSAQHLRQLFQVEALQANAIKTMKRYRDNLAKRSSLSPEQEVELGALDLAMNDMMLKRINTVNQQQELSRHLGYFAGLDCAVGANAIPAAKKLGRIRRNQEAEGAVLAVAKKQVELAQASLTLEEANSWRNLNVGPIFSFQKENLDETYAIGLAVSFEMPFFDRNQGERARAAMELVAKKVELENVRKENQFDLATWYNRYERSLESLNNTAREDLLKKKREKVEKFFARGVISAALVIETYRQLIEFTQSRNEFELSALLAKAQILKLTGKIEQLEL